ncbi:uncharacterized protein LOC129593791 [Paramacrobiotus metropolitanus]|uniref:uncharacterized protein LOC129593791 n=1 Tax=Paramacrobiotus metropolitanus TaxID=2943436 RepID=UPI00244612DC|nr:uncharacterized protein LOC129593791 [Paramacrobiotus metropolitanus]
MRLISFTCFLIGLVFVSCKSVSVEADKTGHGRRPLDTWALSRMRRDIAGLMSSAGAAPYMDASTGMFVYAANTDSDETGIPAVKALHQSADPGLENIIRAYTMTKRRASKMSCLKSCVGNHILHPMQCHSLC